MPPDIFDASDAAETVASDVATFAASLPSESLAKLACFFHLVDPDAASEIELHIDQSGRMTLKVDAFGKQD